MNGIRIIIKATLTDLWATTEELIEMSDAEIIELVQEDTVSLLDGAEWTIERPPIAHRQGGRRYDNESCS